MKFYKYHGIGNDFIVIDCARNNVKIDPDWVRWVCDRHFGIGADGVLFVKSGGADYDCEMVILNSDGSYSKMCGNGIRCVAKYARDSGLVHEDSFDIKTGRGILHVDTTPGKNGQTATVRVDMGAPILNGRDIPIDFEEEFINQMFEVGGFRFRWNAVSMGNPHFITFEPQPDEVIQKLGPLVESHPFFPEKTNVEFATIIASPVPEDLPKIDIKVYERGVGWSYACGTGACATTAAAALNGKVPFDQPIDVHLPGGWLKITVFDNLKSVLMEGPAEFVFEGETEVPVPDETSAEGL